MNPYEKLIFLLRCGLEGEREIDVSELGLDGGTLELIFRLAKRHDVAQTVGAALEANGLLDGGGAAQEKFRKEMMTALYRCENLDFEAEQISRTLSEQGIDHIPLKGAVIREFYPERWMRTSCDVDVLVREEELTAAAEALKSKLGYKQDGGKDYHDVSLYSENGFHLELHYSLREQSERMDPVLDRVWEYATETGEGRRLALDQSFLVFHVIAHAAYHFLGGGCGVRPLIDLYVLRGAAQEGKAELDALLSDAGLSDFARELFRLSEAWFSGAEHSELSRKMANYILRGGAYGNADDSLAMNVSKGGKSKYLVGRIFVPYETLKVHYPVLERHKLLFPVCQIRRWGRIALPGRINRTARALKVDSRDAARRAQELGEMFSSLGLEARKNN